MISNYAQKLPKRRYFEVWHDADGVCILGSVDPYAHYPSAHGSPNTIDQKTTYVKQLLFGASGLLQGCLEHSGSMSFSFFAVLRILLTWHMTFHVLNWCDILEFAITILRAKDWRENMNLKRPKDFRDPIILILEDLGGKARPKEIYEQFAARYPNVVHDPYWGENVDGDLRWRDCINRCRFQVLIPQGLLRKDSKRGTWELA